MSKSKAMRPLFINDVEYKVDGKTYSGTYTWEAGYINVSYDGNSRKAHCQQTTAESMARLVLANLVRESISKRPA
ncbi:hypothetical protein SAMN05216412_101332 [Nitrosospira multiformis]|uniref:Uncharacterized protein n=1 Tax=Nitrosospira multiformis TaxID=1231 RepID=A0A1H9YQ18_9PROT|nr:hypothetical protein [Nitrosospira multiformis]SES71142.1 hypothetical protein SAMN05216412_101332 [Nitrosospira multiformis]